MKTAREWAEIIVRAANIPDGEVPCDESAIEEVVEAIIEQARLEERERIAKQRGEVHINEIFHDSVE